MKETAMASIATGVGAIERTLQKTQEWIKDAETALDREDPHFAFQSIRAVLHILRDRVPLATAVHLGDQLPTLIRGLYYENWTPTHEEKRLERSIEDFVGQIQEYFPKEPMLDSEGIVRAIFRVVASHVSEGEIRAVRATLPGKLSALWE
jgi:uncharacterized protein (DUF2267 family)